MRFYIRRQFHSFQRHNNKHNSIASRLLWKQLHPFNIDCSRSFVLVKLNDTNWVKPLCFHYVQNLAYCSDQFIHYWLWFLTFAVTNIIYYKTLSASLRDKWCCKCVSISFLFWLWMLCLHVTNILSQLRCSIYRKCISY